ncbi:MAG TPA: guanylate kinase [Bacillota bacterium]
MQRGLLIVISGPSGVGKNTVISSLFEQLPDLNYSISATTRTPRDNEVNGQNYYFLTETEFLQKIDADEFLEWAKVYHHYYGTLKSNVLELLAQGRDVVLDVDVQGGAAIKKALPETVLIFLAPPSLKELKNRLLGRSTERPEEIELRLQYIKTELQCIPYYDFLVINDQIDLTCEKIKGIILAEKCRVTRQEIGFVQKLLGE